MTNVLMFAPMNAANFETGNAPSTYALFADGAGGAEWREPAGGAASYAVYTALLTQTGTDAPVATVLENTLGFIPLWERFDVRIGEVAGTYPGIYGFAYENVDVSKLAILMSFTGPSPNRVHKASTRYDTDDWSPGAITLATGELDNAIIYNTPATVDFALTWKDNLLVNTFIQIRTYP